MAIRQIIRFGVYWVDLDLQGAGVGHEQRERRPCVVVSPEAMHRGGMTVICPMTCSIKPNWPYRLQVILNARKCDIMVEQIRAISIERIDAFIEIIDGNTSQRLKAVIGKMLTV